MKWILVWGALLGGAFGAAWYYRDQLKTFADSHRSRPAAAEPAAHSPPGDETIYATGFVEGATQTAELRFEFAGRLEELFVAEGQHVDKGQVLARLDAVLLEQELTQAGTDLELAKAEWTRLKNAARPETRQVAQTQIEVARAELEDFQVEADRIKRLYEKAGASEREWMKAYHAVQIAKAKLAEKQANAKEVEAPAREDDLKVAQSKVEVAHAALEYAKLRLEKTKLTAPTAGTILHLGAELGEMVGPDDENPVFRFANLDSMRIRAYVEELHALKVSEGDAVQVTADGFTGDEPLTGTIVFCSPWMSEKQHRTHKPNELLDVKTREILIELENAKTLVVGLPVDVTISPNSPQVLSVPSQRSHSNSSTDPIDLTTQNPDQSIDVFPEPSEPDRIGLGNSRHENPRNNR